MVEADITAQRLLAGDSDYCNLHRALNLARGFEKLRTHALLVVDAVVLIDEAQVDRGEKADTSRTDKP